MRQPYHHVQDQDFYCSFTHLPSTPLIEDLPYTLTPRTPRQPSYFPSRTPTPKPSSTAPSTAPSSGYWSTTSSLSSSLRRTRLLAKLRKLLWRIVRKSRLNRHSSLKRAQSLRSVRKPSTLDFRCCGYVDEGVGFADAVSERGWFGGWPPLQSCASLALPEPEVPRVDWSLGGRRSVDSAREWLAEIGC